MAISCVDSSAVVSAAGQTNNYLRGLGQLSNLPPATAGSSDSVGYSGSSRVLPTTGCFGESEWTLLHGDASKVCRYFELPVFSPAAQGQPQGIKVKSVANAVI